jgi:hypothetical protein
MADTRLSDLSAAGALAASDLFYVVQTPGSGGEKATGTQLLTLVGTTYVPLAGGTMTGALTIASGTLTASAPSLNITQTWNANAAFTAAKINVTKTLSDGVGLLQDWQLGSVSKANIREDGVLTCVSVVAGAGYVNDLVIASTILLTTDAAATLAQRNGTTQQIFRLYNTYTDASNYERLTLTGVAGTSVNITAETLGTGGDNLDIVLTPAGTGLNKFATGSYFGGSLKVSQSLAGSEDIYITHNAIRMSKWSTLGWNNANTGSGGAFDAGFFREAAGLIAVVTGASSTTYQDLKLRNLLNTEYHQMTEMTAPSAPAANSVRIYAEDNGAGKTRLMALFATGAAQQISIEP